MGRGGSKEEQQHARDTLKTLIKLRKIDTRVLAEIEDANIIEITGWTVDELDRQDANRIEILKTVWSSKAPIPKNVKKRLR